MDYVYSDKKRKLQYDQLLFPLSKHKFRERSNDPDHESPIATCLQTEKNLHMSTIESTTERKNLHTSTIESTTERNTDEGPELSEESVNKDSSNIFAGGYDAAMTPEYKGKTVVSFGNESPHDQSPTSLNSCSTKSFSEALYSLDSRRNTIDKARASFVHGDNCILENTNQMNPKSPINDQLLEFGTYDDYIKSVFESDGIEQCSIIGAEALMLYSNDVLSPDGCSNKEDSRLRPRKPTIDQEFEQYFSMLLL